MSKRRKKPDFDLVADPALAISRLTELRRVLTDELPQVLNGHKFDMNDWIAPVDEGAYEAKVEPLECHTAACMCGWGALLSPKLQAAGLRFRRGQFSGSWWIDGDEPETFGLTEDGFDHLFCEPETFPDHGRGKRALREGIRRLDEALTEAKTMTEASNG